MSDDATPALPSAADALFPGFADPPVTARPRVWWHWMDGNIDPAGIVKDLEWLSSSGAGGVQAFTGSMGIPQYTRERVSFRSPAWQTAISCAASTSTRLGLELAVATSAGWSATGGPWVAPHAGMKKLVWSTTAVTAGQPALPRLAVPPSVSGPFQDVPFGAIRNDPVGVPEFYDDVAVLALPRRGGHFQLTPSRVVASGTTSGDRHPESLADGTFWPTAEVVAASGTTWITAEFDQPTHVSSVRVGLPASRGFGVAPAPTAHVEASTDGVTFSKVADLPASGSPVRSASFPTITARCFRLVLETGKGHEFPLVQGIKPLPFAASKGGGTFKVSAFQLFSGGRVARSEEKAGYAPVPDYYALDGRTCHTSDAVQPQDIIDVTAFLGPDGILDWTPDSGDWTILRYGYSLTGHLNAPAPVDATGLEVDKLDAALVTRYFSDYLGFFEEALGSGLDGVSALLSDSIESGPQNWTGAMRAEFMKRRGYDLLPWLPAISGIVVGSAEQSDSFLWDLRKTISELLAENHYGTIADIARERGLTYYAEALEDHRPQLGDDVGMRSYADVPMGAMWCYEPDKGPQPTYVADLRGAASVAHVYGKAATGAESMSAFGKPFAFAPRTLKPIADLEFALGVNLLNIHTSPHQPEAVPKPGVTLSPYLGQSFTRNETWAHAAKPWLDYLGRCSYLLQQGIYAADVAYFYGEEAPVTGVFGDTAPEVPAGHGFDLINLDGLLNHVTVTPAGGLLTTGGTTYRLLYLGGTSHRMTLRAVRRLIELLQDGALVAGWRPERSPSQSDDPAEWSAAVDLLWGGHPGLIDLAGVAAEEGVSTALARAGVEPDWVMEAAAAANLPVIHRQLPNAELYFVSNQRERAEQVSASFRGTATAAECWDPVAASRTPIAFRPEAGRTAVELQLEPFGSAFVLLHRTGGATVNVSDTSEEIAAAHTLEGPWEVTFDGDGQDPSALVMPGVAPWAGPGADAHGPDVTGFSGTGTYRHTFSTDGILTGPGKRLLLDLGGVSELAEVRVNGSTVGTLWTCPFRVDVTDAIRAGSNEVEIAVTNTWWNRLAGDAAEGNFARPAASIFEPDAPTMPAGLHGPVRLLVLDD
ncbi:glycoside hydrolase family 2 sugar binding [Pseudarthrobacter chlorophenolicus A6]|uniref:Glycoside hydrolase family 2 sugar binding n=1 Tax=Pseudarthrobacter chlorophenolicus (strain ATCC 700700 / DSM 12829 / CIP 107037 / JCM 12360 / KCTC 9906 / NCIMB 13794 / A6) TaxID=452863 RepID=B8H6G5_PSECP|nr:glycosyl hydrolase [Pseudarthrobacter chlorophenolicus]ACL41491.1 glycoside hydrolase family 2 sugar binding [Pseudarthrobacter chlorophenolicus A6]SDQ63235.1 Glycosyl hydrolases family 2, sugar binding domain [Pseudarthrobacter chlorophenolicus]